MKNKSKYTHHGKSAHLSQSVLCEEICVVWPPDQRCSSWSHPTALPAHQGAPDCEQHLMVRLGWCFQTPTLPRVTELCAATTNQLVWSHLKRKRVDVFKTEQWMIYFTYYTPVITHSAETQHSVTQPQTHLIYNMAQVQPSARWPLGPPLLFWEEPQGRWAPPTGCTPASFVRL